MTAGRRSRGGAPKRRALGALKWLAAATLLITGAAVLTVTQTGVARHAVLPAIGAALGSDAEASSVRLRFDGSIHIEKLRLAARSTPAPAAQFLAAEAVTVGIDWTALVSGGGGGGAVRRITLIDPLVRLSLGDDRSLNIQPVVDALASRPGAASSAALPEVQIVDGVLELGEHTREWYAPISTIDVAGGLSRDPRRPGVATLTLDERGGTGGTPAPLIVGAIDPASGTASFEIESADLDRWSRRLAPALSGAWRSMFRSSGEIRDARVLIEPRGVTLSASLQDVACSIPLPATIAPAPGADAAAPDISGTRPLEMTGVSGEVLLEPDGLSATLEGSVGDLPIRTRFAADGLGTDAPVRVTIETERFALTRDPGLLPFAPEFVRKVLRRFSGPTATISGEVRVARGAPTASGPGPWSYSGRVELEDGTAAFAPFPYAFERMSGVFAFDDERFVIERISGSRENGATLEARGVITPPGDGARVAIDVIAENVPLDADFRAALPAERAAVYDALFNDEQHAALREAGLVRPPNTPGTPGTPQTPGAPFRLGGVARLDIAVRREPGLDTRYTSDVTIEAPEAGLLPVAFPYPVVAEMLRVRLSGGMATIEPTTLRGLTGAVGMMSGAVEYTDGDPPVYRPRLSIDADHVPIDAFLLTALPGRSETGMPDAGDAPDEPSAPAGFSPARLLSQLGIEGSVRCRALVHERGGDIGDWVAALGDGGARPAHPTNALGGRGDVGFYARVDLAGLRASPGGGAIIIDAVGGSMTLTDHSVSVGELTGLLAGAPFRLSVDAVFPSFTFDRDLSATGSFDADRFDFSLPIHELVALVAPDRAGILSALAQETRPEGTARLALDVALAGDELDLGARVDRVDRLAMDVLGSRAEIRDVKGVIEITPRRVRFAGVEGELAFGLDPSARLRLDGGLALEPGEDEHLDGALDGLRLESELVAAALTRATPEVLDPIRDYECSGVIDFRFGVPSAGAADLTGLLDRAAARWTVSPRSLSFRHHGAVAAFPSVAGAVRGVGGEGTIDQIRAEAEDGTVVSVDGSWTPAAEDGTSPELGLTLSASAPSWTPTAAALLPERAREAVERADVAVSGGIGLSNARIDVRLDRPNADGADRPLRFGASGRLLAEGVSADLGLRVDDLTGVVRFEASGTLGPEGPVLDAEAAVEAATLRVLGVTMSDARASLLYRAGEGAIVAPSLVASCHGGRAAARGRVSLAGGASGREADTYEFHAELAGVAFGPFLAELRPSEADDLPIEPIDRGLLDASVAVAESRRGRRGRGVARVQGGDVLNMPGVLRLLELSNLQPPTGERVDLGYAEFFLDDDRLAFDELVLYSPSVRIAGRGGVSLPGLELDLRFGTSGRQVWVPVVSDVLEALREGVVTTRVTGTAYDPSFELEQLAGGGRLLDAIFGGPQTTPGPTPPTLRAGAEAEPQQR